MSQDISSFYNRMKIDCSFRRKMLFACKTGNLMDTLLMEGYTFSPEELDKNLPQVRTGIRAGSCGSCTPCGCGSE